ncbi:MAG TPA: hypothetical protein VFD03_04370 [Clostridia bacterium]|nr:hypothetical protein [Clostridia bacterium]
MNELEKMSNILADIESTMVLGGDYRKELDMLDAIENDVNVLHHLGAPTWKIRDILEDVRRIQKWIVEELNVVNYSRSILDRDNGGSRMENS